MGGAPLYRPLQMRTIQSNFLESWRATGANTVTAVLCPGSVLHMDLHNSN